MKKYGFWRNAKKGECFEREDRQTERACEKSEDGGADGRRKERAAAAAGRIPRGLPQKFYSTARKYLCGNAGGRYSEIKTESGMIEREKEAVCISNSLFFLM